jgi:hypothetical protein
MKRIIFLIIAIAAAVALLNSAALAEMKKKVTLFPFSDLSSHHLDAASTSWVAAELLKKGFIELVPPEVVRQRIYDMESDSFWTGKKGKKNTRGTLWKIQPEMVDKISRGFTSDYSVYGDISRSEGKREIRTYISDRNANVLKVFSVSAENRDEMPQKLAKLGRDIAAFLARHDIVEAAEEEVRKYLGMLSSLPTVIGKIEKMSSSSPESLPLKAILLDLYLKDETAYGNKIFDSASEIIKIYDPANGDDTRYLLSRYLDPFDVLAEQYEARGDWKKSIEIRERALRDFSFFSEKHKTAIEALRNGEMKQIKGK